MFQPKPKSKLDLEIDKLVLKLKDHEPTSKEYATVVTQLSQLHKIREESRPDRLSWNTGATVAANLLGILMIVQQEHLHVITSKALPFVKKA